MNLFSGIEKLINEHGSSAILRERIALANDQYSALESKVKSLESEVAKLKLQKTELELDNNKLREQTQALMERISGFLLQKSPLDEVKLKILVALTNTQQSSAKEISDSIGISEQQTEFHLNELHDAKYISHSFGAITVDDSPIRPWSINQKGRKHLAENNLLK